MLILHVLAIIKIKRFLYQFYKIIRKMSNNALKINLVMYASYLVFYTGYSKETKRLEPSQLIDIMTFKKGLHTWLV